MPHIDLTNPGIRTEIISEIGATENLERKELSLGQYEIFKDRIRPWVTKYLEGFYKTETINELPIIASINIARRIVTKEAGVYSTPPTRTFQGMTEAQAQFFADLYEQMNIDSIMQKANQYYKLQDGQIHLYIVPSQGRLKARVLLGHQLDVVPSMEDPESGEAYIVNGFDRSLNNIKLTESENNTDQIIADVDDYKSSLEAMAVWSDQYNFIMSKNGDIISGPETNNELGIAPVVDISCSKDGEYWNRSGASVTDFTIQFNAAMTDLAHIVRMQGFGQAWMKGAENLIPKNIQIGPNFILKLPIDANSPVETDFGYANANADIAGSIQQIELLLSSFLTSRGLDPKLVNGSKQSEKFTSGFDRLLSMIEMFEPSKNDFSVFSWAEDKMFEIIKRYVNAYGGTAVLPKYKAGTIPEGAYVDVKFAEPQIVMSEQDKIQLIRDKRELGLMSRTESIALDRDIDIEEAKKIAVEIDQEDSLNVGAGNQTQQNESVTDN